jgi:hypothetical protein
MTNAAGTVATSNTTPAVVSQLQRRRASALRRGRSSSVGLFPVFVMVAPYPAVGDATPAGRNPAED